MGSLLVKSLRARSLLALAALVFFPLSLCAQPSFPALSGRVVDSANILNAAEESSLTQALQQHETETANQLVIVTLTDLQGYAIEDYANRLGRHWQIGQEGNDNGAMLIVAQSERKVRIEVGYGLEGALTDALTSNIIQTVILPRFRSGQFPAGIAAGTIAMIETLNGEYEPRPTTTKTDARVQAIFFFIFIAVVIYILMGAGTTGGGRGGSGYPTGYRYGGGYSRRGGGGFSGGGGSFGGGGASGGW